MVSGTDADLQKVPSGGGQPMDPQTRATMEARFRRDFQDVRVHVDNEAAASADVLAADAYTIGRDMYFAADKYAPTTDEGQQLLAHELTHTLQQTEGVASGPQRQPTGKGKPATTDANEKQAQKIGAGQTGAARERAPYWGTGVAATPEERATPGQVRALQIRFDLLIAIFRASFPKSTDTVSRLQAERTRVESIHRDDVLKEGDQLEAAQFAADSVALIQKGLPDAVPDDLKGPYDGVVQAVNATARDLATDNQATRLKETQTAAEKYVDAFTSGLLKKTQEAAEKLASTPAGFDDANPFINGLARNGRIVFGSTLDHVGAYTIAREWTLDDMKKLGDLGKIAASPLADRLRFLEEHGPRVTSLMKRIEGILILASAFLEGSALMSAVADASDQMVWSDIAIAMTIRDSVIAPIAKHLPGTPPENVLKAASGALQSQHAAVTARCKDVQEYLEKVHTFAQLAAVALSLYGGMAAMEAAGGSGVTVGVAGMPQIALGQFIRGSLAFTMGSQMVMSALTLQPITIEGFTHQALMDMATFGLMHSVGFGLAGRYGGAANVPAGVQAGAQFAALWAWTAGFEIAAQRDPVTASGVVKTIATTGQHTALMLMMGAVAHKIGTLPKLTIPEAPDPALAVRQKAAIQQYEQLVERGKTLESQINSWAEKRQSPEDMQRLLRQSEGWYGEYNARVRALHEAQILDKAQADALIAEAGKRAGDLRNLRDMSRLAMRETGQSTVAYSGDVRNVDVFLGRLLRQKMITAYEAVGREGIYKVTDADGRVSFYYPEGATPESSRGMNLVADALAETFPDASVATRSNAAAALDALPAAEATQVALQLTGPKAQAVLEWLAELGSKGGAPRFVSGDLLQFVASREGPLEILRGERQSDLDAWAQTSFEQVVRNRSGGAFLEFISEVRQRRGSLKVAGPAEAQAITTELAAAAEVSKVVAPGPSVSAPGSVHEPTVWEWVQGQQRRGMTGEFVQATIDGQVRVLQLRDGVVIRSWTWNGSEGVNPVDVKGTLDLLKAGVQTADKTADPAQRAALMEALGPYADSVSFLRRVRGGFGASLEISEALNLIDRIRPKSVPAETKPAAEIKPEPAPDLPPVTTRDMYITRHRMLTQRAANQGMTGPLLDAVQNWNPRTGENAPSNPTATLELLEQQLNSARDAALKQYRKKFKGEMDRVKQAFGGREDFADFLVTLSGSHKITPEMMRGLGYMTQEPPPGIKRPIDVNDVLGMSRTAAERNMVLQQFARIMEAQPGGIPGGYRMLSDMTINANNWRGGAWILKWMAENPQKIGEIASFEQQDIMTPAESGAPAKIDRRYDVVLKSGKTLEFKSWTNWFPESILKQFRKDVLLHTRSFTFLGNIENIRWLFEGPPGMTEMTPDGPRFNRMSVSDARKAIREQMRLGLEEAMNEVNVPQDQRPMLRQLFDQAAGKIIEIHPGKP
jgi:hypothetical protein